MTRTGTHLPKHDSLAHDIGVEALRGVAILLTAALVFGLLAMVLGAVTGSYLQGITHP